MKHAFDEKAVSAKFKLKCYWRHVAQQIIVISLVRRRVDVEKKFKKHVAWRHLLKNETFREWKNFAVGVSWKSVRVCVCLYLDVMGVWVWLYVWVC